MFHSGDASNHRANVCFLNKMSQGLKIQRFTEKFYTVWGNFLSNQDQVLWLMLGSYLIHVLRPSWVSAVANQPCETYWASLSGPSCNILHNEDILVSFLYKASQRDDFDLCWRWRWKDRDWGAINELHAVKGALQFCLTRLVTSCQIFFSFHRAASAWLFFSAEVIQVH